MTWTETTPDTYKSSDNSHDFHHHLPTDRMNTALYSNWRNNQTIITNNYYLGLPIRGDFITET